MRLCVFRCVYLCEREKEKKRLCVFRCVYLCEREKEKVRK